MTDATPRPDDEIVSAVLDGEATADERALVEADPEAQARLAELRAARDQVAAPVAVPPAVREQAVAAALDLFDQLAPEAPPTSRPPGPDWVPGVARDGSGAAPTSSDPAAPAAPSSGDELAARRAARSGGRSGRWLVAAAAVVVLVLGVGAVVRSMSSRGETVASSSLGADEKFESVGDASEGGNEPAAPQEQTDEDRGPVTTSTAPAPVVPTTTAPSTTTFAVASTDLGNVPTVGQLRDRMLEVVDQTPPLDLGRSELDTAGGALASVVPCAATALPADPELGALLAVATADLQGQPVSVLAFSVDRQRFPAANGTVRIYAFDPASCAVVATVTTR
jgi:hypothetical protein